MVDNHAVSPVIKIGHQCAYSKFMPDLSQIHTFELVTSSADDRGKEHIEKEKKSMCPLS